ncbi:DUF2306 domain-containing protein [Halalkalibacter nanhaiisediminis]|uniref:Uncharacterized protein n=1 Tax=Halalkalibacter nanhaiisediminis TaxID=688079 RepID=A0A562QN18_9BACI|nr:DUF2306 domain-containing protein [Halalkalibacter nanhaiisediminis]TWI58161.1 hypothetical protein IQ10_01494 [Halalkalibacter nanhaiisediminis]
MLVFDGIRIIHIIAGFLALFTFWIPVVTRKGGGVHRGIGWVYTISMVVVSISAFYMGVYRIFFDSISDQTVIAFSWFLIFIGLLSGSTAWYGIRVLHFKRRKHPHRVIIDLLIPLFLLLGGIGMVIYGHLIDFPLLAWFPLVGIFLGASHLWYWLRIPKMKKQWWIEHLVGMLSCSIATITAFTVFGAPQLIDVESVHPVLWFIPTIIIVPMIIAFTCYYTKKFK